jgi:hypothetical protein
MSKTLGLDRVASLSSMVVEKTHADMCIHGSAGEKGGVVVTFPDVPEVITRGRRQGGYDEAGPRATGMSAFDISAAGPFLMRTMRGITIRVEPPGRRIGRKEIRPPSHDTGDVDRSSPYGQQLVIGVQEAA